MSNDTKWFRDVNTGKVAEYPARFANRFSTLVEIDPSDAACFECFVTSEPETDIYPLDLLNEADTDGDDD